MIPKLKICLEHASYKIHKLEHMQIDLELEYEKKNNPFYASTK
jgi:hypothetical protein